MQALLRAGLRSLGQRRGRAALVGTGVALGVALMFSVLCANASIMRTFESLLGSFIGGADVLVAPIGGPDATLPLEEASRLASLDGVEAAVPSLSFPAEIRSRGRRRDLRLEGVDPVSDARLRSYRLTGGRMFRPGALEAVVSKYATIGERFEVIAPTGRHQLTVVGTVTDTGVGGAVRGGSLSLSSRLLTSVGTAGALAGKPNTTSAVSIALRDGVNPGHWIAGHPRDLAGFQVRSGDAVERRFRNTIRSVLGIFAFVAATALYVGGFLIYLTLSRAVHERARTHGLMRALGAARRQVRRAVVAEAALIGACATAAGLALGLAVSKAVIALFSGAFGDLPLSLVVPLRAVAVSASVGIGTTLVAAAVPAWRAGRVPPSEAMRPGPAAARASRAWIAGTVLAALGLAGSMAGPDEGSWTFTLLLLLGVALLGPIAMRSVASLVGRITRGAGQVAVRHLVHEQSRSGYTLSLVMVVLAMILATAAIGESIERTIARSLGSRYAADLVAGRSTRTFAPEVERRLRERPDVAAVTAVRHAATKAAGQDGSVTIVDPDTYFALASFHFVQGDAAEAAEALRGEAVLASEGLARRGGEMSIETSRGPKRFRVAGVYRSLFERGVVMGLDAGRAYLNAGDPSELLIKVGEGREEHRVAEALELEFAQYGLDVETTADLTAERARSSRRFGDVFFAILAVAAIVGMLGLANTLAMSMQDRAREIGVMRAVGADRGHVRAMVVIESATIGLTAFVLALPLGWLLSLGAVRGISSGSESTISYAFPATWVPMLAAAGLTIALAAALVPAWRVGRLRPADALRYE